MVPGLDSAVGASSARGLLRLFWMRPGFGLMARLWVADRTAAGAGLVIGESTKVRASREITMSGIS